MWMLLVKVSSIFATLLLGASYVPQIIQLYETKETKGINLSFWIVLDLSLLMLFILAIDSYLNTGDTSLVFAQGLNLFLGLTVLSQVIYYRKDE